MTAAGLIGFGLGGAGLGLGLWSYLYTAVEGRLDNAQPIYLLAGMFVFGIAGGAALGMIYSWIASASDQDEPTYHRTWLDPKRYIVVSILLILIVILFRPILNTVRQTLTPVEAQLSTILGSNTIGTHWSDIQQIQSIPSEASNPGMYVTPEGLISVVWSQPGGNQIQQVLLLQGQYDRESNQTEWEMPILVSEHGAVDNPSAQVAIDSNGGMHVVWNADNDDEGSGIYYSQCSADECTHAIVLSNSNDLNCIPSTGEGSHSNMAASIAFNHGEIMVSWYNNSGALPFTTWSTGALPQENPLGCIPIGGSISMDASEAPQLVSGPDDGFSIIYSNTESSIQISQYQEGQWSSVYPALGNGKYPTIHVDSNDEIHAAWCDNDGVLNYWYAENSQAVSTIPCTSRPVLSTDNRQAIRILWYSDVVENSFSMLSNNSVLYEVIQLDGGWSPPTIVTQNRSDIQPVLSNAGEDSFHLVWSDWNDMGSYLNYTTQVQYHCDVGQFEGINQVLFEIAGQAKYRAPGTVIPACQNRYDNLVFTPNPEPAFSDDNPYKNGAFELASNLIQDAKYEVLFATMWYDKDLNSDSPGSVLAVGVAELYRQLQEHPENYPRGLTVRLLLGNPPEFATGEYSDQTWSVISDLRDAGVDKMVDPELGWSLEVANFKGALPHSHVKTLIIDGKTAIAAGFNTTYNHFPIDHSSEKGNSRHDLGIQLTGPIAQDTQRVFDDLWAGADRRHCSDLHPPVDQVWQATCFDTPATSEHVPEVLRYYLPGDEAVAFSMYRSHKRDEADQLIISAISEAQESIDTIHVNFTLPLICDLNLLFNLCTIENSLAYMQNLLIAAEDNGTNVRILLKLNPIEGIENLIAIELFIEYLQERGLDDRVQVRVFEGDVHHKSILIDDELLIVGSQNFHYSAFGEGAGLTEYSLGTDDPQAIEDYSRLFEYHWERAEAIE